MLQRYCCSHMCTIVLATSTEVQCSFMILQARTSNLLVKCCLGSISVKSFHMQMKFNVKGIVVVVVLLALSQIPTNLLLQIFYVMTAVLRHVQKFLLIGQSGTESKQFTIFHLIWIWNANSIVWWFCGCQYWPTKYHSAVINCLQHW